MLLMLKDLVFSYSPTEQLALEDSRVGGRTFVPTGWSLVELLPFLGFRGTQFPEFEGRLNTFMFLILWF